jgi:hypothetical protein
MCSLIASFVGMEAVKVLTKHITPDNINRRGEFDIYDMISMQNGKLFFSHPALQASIIN